jgi:hypothetical protein
MSSTVPLQPNGIELPMAASSVGPRGRLFDPSSVVPSIVSQIAVSTTPGCSEFTRTPSFAAAHSSATDLVNNRTAPLLALYPDVLAEASGLPVRPDIGGDDDRALAGEQQRRRSPDAAGGAGDASDLPVDSTRHLSPPAGKGFSVPEGPPDRHEIPDAGTGYRTPCPYSSAGRPG